MLTPAALVALVRAAVVVTGRSVARVEAVGGQSLAFTVAFSFVLLPPVVFTVAPVVRPPVHRAVVVAGNIKPSYSLASNFFDKENKNIKCIHYSNKRKKKDLNYVITAGRKCLGAS